MSQLPSHFPNRPRALWENFFHITQTPRPSKKEEKIQELILDKANSLGLKSQTDETGNIVVYVPGTHGLEKSDPVIIQNHMDMVTDALPDVAINFLEDPIETYQENGWLLAKGTTLGADNGIGCAAALALMEDQSVKHPPLEVLFTTDEETGLNGAWGVQGKFFKGKKLLNLDAEEWGSVYIGCAGGLDYELEGELTLDEQQESTQKVKLTVEGFTGGHSGLEIHLQRGNAIKCLNEILLELSSQQVCLHEIRGGRAHNIIPRECWCTLSGEVGLKEKVEQAAKEVLARYKRYLPDEDQNITFKVTDEDFLSQPLDKNAFARLTSFLSAFPHGAHSYDRKSDHELVSLSNNLAKVLVVKGKFYLLTSARFFERGECVKLEHEIQSLAKMVNFSYSKNTEYPSWKPNRETQILAKVREVYRENFQGEAKVKAIHAGLECGILREQIGDIEAISFGPTIMGAHTPKERVEVSSVEKFWNLLTQLLAQL